jgi:uncharacterized protein (TIGR02453 family)
VSDPSIPSSALDFLKLLRENNNRDWFHANKELFLEQQMHIERFADVLLSRMQVHDVIENVSGKSCLQRIYRDTRFSKDKTPYKTHWAGGFTRATAKRRGGYYFHLEPRNSFMAGGFWAPNSADIRRIRDDIGFDATPLRNIINNSTFVETFGQLHGERLKTMPKGFDKEHEAGDLLRYKQFLLIRRFTDDDVLSPSFPAMCDQTYIHMRPFFDYMSEVLTMDADGVSASQI